MLTKTLRATLLGTALVAAPIAAATLSAQTAQVQAAPMLQSFAPLVEAAKPAVVTVATKSAMMASGQPDPRLPPGMQVPPGMEDFFERFFGDRPGQPGPAPRAPRQGIGSGFIIDSAGVIVTNNHVIDGAEEVTVILDDGTEHEATLVGRDTRVDIAVLRIEAEGLPTVEWGDSDAVRVGDWALAIGNPLGLDGTVTAGIVSARGRDINSGPYDDYLQVDVAINRGNSGGPLFDLNGKVIGVNTAIISPTGGNVGLGFSIPSAQAQEIVADLLENGTVERGWIGVSIQTLDEEIAQSLGLPGTSGALVAEVVPDSPAEAAGLRAGDVILGFADSVVDEVRDLTRAVAAWEAGVDADITVWRDGSDQVLSIRPALLETADAGSPARVLPAGVADVPELGLTLEATGDDRVAVREVAPGTSAEESGLRPGDVILSVNQTLIDAPEAVKPVLAEAREKDRPTVLVLVERDGARRFVTLELAST
ncbi:Do family serine endopeptidase [Oceanibium sediminis]|uniref:Do family serine endopeptidase n=1 Tax=Oceanibium sediminis TaxID=2026339 RepID=UPI0018E528D9|nr:Do family serine endopeptidase [Oceanibium sediminis]